MSSRLPNRLDDDSEGHITVDHENHVSHLQAAIEEANAALGWLKAWPNHITNAESELESAINVLRVALRRAHGDEAGSPVASAAEPPVYSFDADGDVDLADSLECQACFSGSGTPHAEGCEPCDFDQDGEVDLADTVAFQAAFTGAR